MEDDLTRETRGLMAKLEDVLMACDERGVWEELARAVDLREHAGEVVTGEYIMHTWAALCKSNGGAV